MSAKKMDLSFHIIKTLSLTFRLTQKLGEPGVFTTRGRVVGRRLPLSPHSEVGCGFAAVLSSCWLSAGDGELLVSHYSASMTVHGLASHQGKVMQCHPAPQHLGKQHLLHHASVLPSS